MSASAGEPAASLPEPTPWMTVNEVAAYSRHCKDHILRALREFQRSKGTRGLKGSQPSPHSSYRVHIDDVLRWMDGKPPAKGLRRWASRSNRPGGEPAKDSLPTDGPEAPKGARPKERERRQVTLDESIDEYITKLVADWPPLTPRQIATLRPLLSEP